MDLRNEDSMGNSENSNVRITKKFMKKQEKEKDNKEWVPKGYSKITARPGSELNKGAINRDVATENMFWSQTACCT